MTNGCKDDEAIMETGYINEEGQGLRTN